MLSETIKVFFDTKVDLNDYSARFKSTDTSKKSKLTQYKNLVFQDFTFEYIGDIDPNDRATWPEGFDDQIGIRQVDNLDERTDELAYEFRVNGWDTSFFPPIVTTCGKWRDGRGRVIAARKLGVKYIPVARFTLLASSQPKSDAVTTGLQANFHKPVTLLAMEDFVVAAISVIDSGELEREDSAIENWLLNECKFERRFDKKKGGILKKVVAQVMDRTRKDKNLVVIRDGDDWKKRFISKMSNGKEVLLLMANTGNSAMKYYVEHLLKNGGTPKPLVLYSSSFSQEKAANDVKVFMERVETFFAQSYQLVNNSIDSVDIKTPKKLPCEILGVIPNFSSPKHVKLLSEYKLISVEEYIADGLDVSELKLVS